MTEATLNLLLTLYFAPLSILALYFTILKIEDMNKTEKAFSKDKLSYVRCIGVCFIPVVNMIATIKMIKVQFFE